MAAAGWTAVGIDLSAVPLRKAAQSHLAARPMYSNCRSGRER